MKKRIQQLHRKLSMIARDGMNGYSQYKTLINEIIRNKEINILLSLFEIKYRVVLKDVTQTKLLSIEVYNIVRFNTNSFIIEEVDKLFVKAKMTYVNNIVYDKDNIQIGIIKETNNKLYVHIISSLSDEEISFDVDGLLNAYKSAISLLK